jgi:hypothetical protein
MSSRLRNCPIFECNGKARPNSPLIQSISSKKTNPTFKGGVYPKFKLGLIYRAERLRVRPTPTKLNHPSNIDVDGQAYQLVICFGINANWRTMIFLKACSGAKNLY